MPTEQIYQSILKKTEDGIRRDLQSYFVDWKPEYERLVEVHYRWTLGGEYPRLAWASALTAQMIYEQPIVHELERLKAPALLVIGQEDRTALGKDRASKKAAATLGQHPQLGQRAAKAIPQANLVELDAVGHLPHLEAEEKFHQALLDFLREKRQTQVEEPLRGSLLQMETRVSRSAKGLESRGEPLGDVR